MGPSIWIFPSISTINGTTGATGPIQIGLEDVRLQLPIRGLWSADIITDNVPTVPDATNFNLTPGYGVLSPVYLDLGGDWMFVGQILRYGVWRDSIHARIVGGSANWGQFPVGQAYRNQSGWLSMVQALVVNTTTNRTTTQPLVMGSGTQGLINALLPTNWAPANDTYSSQILNLMVNNINMLTWRGLGLQNSALLGLIAPEFTPQQRVSLQTAFTERGWLSYFNWRILPLSKTLFESQTGTNLEAGQVPPNGQYPISTIVWDFVPNTPIELGAYPGASYPVSVGTVPDPIVQDLNVYNANWDPFWPGSQPSPVPRVNATATLRDINPESGIESYGVEYPVLLPGNWYDSPMGDYNYVANNSGNQLPTVQALDVEYRFRESKLQMTIRTRSALTQGNGPAPFIIPVGGN